MPDTLTRELARVIDASAAPVTVEEVAGPARGRRNQWPVLAAAAAIVVAAVAAGVLVRSNDQTDQLTPVSTTAAPIEVPPLESCVRYVFLSSGPQPPPCRVTDQQAEVMLGIPINQPEGIPAGWTLVHHDVRFWTDEPEMTEDVPDIADFNRAWFRDPAEIETGVPCTTQQPPVCPGDHVQVVVRPALAEELDVRRLQRGPHLVPQVPGIPSQRFEWVANGRYYRVQSYGLPPETALQIAQSLE